MSEENKVIANKTLSIAFAGCANAGKSTLINTLLARNDALVSGMAQTTRRSVPYRLNKNDTTFLLWDAPGLLEAKTKLDGFIRREAMRSLKRADACVLVVAATAPFNALLNDLCYLLRKHQKMPVFLVFSKIDQPEATKNINTLQTQITSIITPAAIFQANCKEGAPSALLATLSTLSPLDPSRNDGDLIRDATDDDDFIICEAVRGAIIKYTRDELPHACAVTVETKHYDAQKNALTVQCAIVVEKQGQKAIVIGHGGQMIKRIGIHAREALSDIYSCLIHLKLFCRVQPDWRDNDYHVMHLGHKPWR